jgi:FG-GAP-like repeat
MNEKINHSKRSCQLYGIYTDRYQQNKKRYTIMIKTPLKNIIICAIMACSCLNSTYAQKTIVNLKKNNQYSHKKSTYQIGLEDFDMDGDLDAVCANMGYNHSQILLNDGNGNFTDSGQKLTQQGHGVGIDDLNGDGSPDIFIVCAGYKSENEEKYNEISSKIYFNNGKGLFYDSKQNLGDEKFSGNAIQLADIDSDGDIDAVIEYNSAANILYLNNGNGKFTKSDITIPKNPLLLDVDNDGDMDIFSRQIGWGFKAQINDGGNFTKYWTMKDTTITYGSSVSGDIDNDNDLDIILTNGTRNFCSPTKILLNNGKGVFTYSEQKLSTAIFGRIGIGDLNDDGYLDLFITSLGESNRIWYNDGSGKFIECDLIFGSKNLFQRPIIEDLNNDGIDDVFISNFDGGSNEYSNEIWLNQEK